MFFKNLYDLKKIISVELKFDTLILKLTLNRLLYNIYNRLLILVDNNYILILH